MSWYKLAQSDFFENFNIPQRRIVKKDSPTTKPITLTLYRSFDADINKLEKTSNGFILSPEKCEQGVLWFSQSRNVAEGRGKYLLTYPLQAKKHYQTIHYEDGDTTDITPESFLDLVCPTENCKYFMGLELPEGWLFSYKTEKHIVSTIPIIITQNMIQLNGAIEKE